MMKNHLDGIESPSDTIACIIFEIDRIDFDILVVIVFSLVIIEIVDVVGIAVIAETKILDVSKIDVVTIPE
jgi:hypothetical protein